MGNTTVIESIHKHFHTFILNHSLEVNLEFFTTVIWMTVKTMPRISIRIDNQTVVIYHREGVREYKMSDPEVFRIIECTLLDSSKGPHNTYDS